MKGFRDNLRKNTILRWSLLFSSWLFQGIINSDFTEKCYKVLFTALFTTIFSFLFLHTFKEVVVTILISFFFAHTLNWLVNGPVAAVFIHCLLMGKIGKEEVFTYLQQLENRLKYSNAISYCAVFGSIARGALKDNSDIDVGFLRKPGITNAIRGLYFITRERILTNLRGIPFEGYLVDSIGPMLTRFKEENVPIILKQSESHNSYFLPIGINLGEARVLNKL